VSLFDDLHDFRCTVPSCATCELLRGEDETLEQWHARIRSMLPDEETCRNGHPRTEENVFIREQGWSLCILCRNESNSRYRKRQKATATPSLVALRGEG
jgi:hypothetical protein